MRAPSSLAGRTYLLAFDRERDRLATRTELTYALRAALLTDLIVGGHLVDVGGHAVAVAGVRAPNDPILRAVLAGAPGHRWRTLIGRHRRETENAVANQLDAAGYIRVIRPATRWRRSRVELRDPRVVTRLQERVSALLRGPVSIDRTPSADVALIAILAVAEIKTGLTTFQTREYADRISVAVTAAGPVIVAMRQAIRAARTSAS